MRRGSSIYSLICKGISEHEQVNNVLNMTNLDKESNRLTAVEESVVVSQSKVHHLTVDVSHVFLMNRRKEKKHTGRISIFPFTTTGLSLMA